MIIFIKAKKLIAFTVIVLLLICSAFIYTNYTYKSIPTASSEGYIKWVNFNIPTSAMDKAMNLDIKSYNSDIKLNWIEILAYMGTKYGGTWSRYKSKDMDNLVKKLKSGETIENLTIKMKTYNYYYGAYSAVLSGFVGEYKIQTDKNNKTLQSKYGLKAFSPIARGYGFSHYDDFGDSRSFGFKRKHLGNDLMGNIGIPITAVESGTVEIIGWNIYGGWRIGIRSFDKKRYYYYAHLRKDKPYQSNLSEGKVVMAGDVIGYLGMTGYSTKENTNNIQVPHLHFGMQLIFDESQKESNNEIWIDVYSIINLLQKNQSAVYRDTGKKEYYRLYDFLDSQIPNKDD